MEIKIRKLSSNTIEKLNQLAKENNLSREEFLREEIEEIAFKNQVEEKENEYQELVKMVIDAITLNTKVLGEFMENYILDGEDAYNLIIDYPHKKNRLESKLSNIDQRITNDSDTKDLLIRNVPINLVNRIDEVANKRNKNRNDYLLMYLNQLMYSNSLVSVDEKYKYMLEKSIGILDFNSRIFKLFYDENIIDISRFIDGGNE